VDWHQDATQMLEQLVALRDATIEGCPRYYAIIDLSTVKVGFSDVVMALGALRRVNQKRRPDMPAYVSLVGSGSILQLISQAVGQQQYGEYHVQMYTDMDKALGNIHIDIATWSTSSVK
jgi:hypothetical protein